MGYLTLFATDEARYFGVASGISLADMVQVAVSENVPASSSLDLPSPDDRPFSCHMPTEKTEMAPMPSSAMGELFIKTYLSRMHPLYPFLSKKSLWDAHSKRNQLETPGDGETTLSWITLHMVYAIGARCLQLIGAQGMSDVAPERHYVSAMTKIHAILKVPGLRNVEVALLLAIYAMRSPSG
jgi:hypothetical protein